MGRALAWIGRGCFAVGALLIAANVVMQIMGLSASYNIGDPSKFEFVLVSFWQVGAALVGVGALAVIVAGRV